MLLLLFDVYLTWARIEKQAFPSSNPVLNHLAQQPIILQYIFFRKDRPLPSLARILNRHLTFASNPLLSLNPRLPSQHPSSYLLAPLPPPHAGPLSPVSTSQLCLDRPPRLIVDEALPDSNGDMGI